MVIEVISEYISGFRVLVFLVISRTLPWLSG